jgi:hypothetical protein
MLVLDWTKVGMYNLVTITFHAAVQGFIKPFVDKVQQGAATKSTMPRLTDRALADCTLTDN